MNSLLNLSSLRASSGVLFTESAGWLRRKPPPCSSAPGCPAVGCQMFFCQVWAAERGQAAAGSCLAAPPLALRVGKHGSSRSFPVTARAASSKALAKSIWQGAGEIECLIVFFFFLLVSCSLKRGRNTILSGEKSALARSHSGAGRGLNPVHREHSVRSEAAFATKATSWVHGFAADSRTASRNGAV